MTQAAGIAAPKLVLVLGRATRSLTEFLEAGLAREGIQMTDFVILEALLHKGPLAIAAIEQKVRLATAPLEAAIERLRRRGVVSAQRDRGKFHGDRWELTDDGRKT
jgi:MarR family transcriptional regulator, 2-MHQ and catechol-resistance regulon repressor